VAVPFDAITRRRDVKVSWEFDVVDAETGHVLTHRGEDVLAAARTVYTLFSADGSDEDFCVAPPEGFRPANLNAERAQESWQESFGSWTVPKLLEHARAHRSGRTRYRPDFRAEFSPRTMTRPVFLDDLPPADDLAYVALEDVWEPLFDSLRELDARD
jgi:hypothetical protein